MYVHIQISMDLKKSQRKTQVEIHVQHKYTPVSTCNSPDPLFTFFHTKLQIHRTYTALLLDKPSIIVHTI